MKGRSAHGRGREPRGSQDESPIAREEDADEVEERRGFVRGRSRTQAIRGWPRTV